jgi:uncharacterized MnhB-related membrane protein
VITRLHADKSLSTLGEHAVNFILFFAWLLILVLTSSVLLIVANTTINPIILLSLLPVVILLSVLAFDRG